MDGPNVLTCGFGWWWIFPIGMIVLCVFTTRRGKSSMPRCCVPRGSGDVSSIDSTDSASQILDKRYALGEIGKEEYEEKKRTLASSADPKQSE